MKTNKHIAIVRSNIKRLSSLSQVSCDALEKLLSLHFKKVSVIIVNEQSDLVNILQVNPDVVFIGMSSVPTNFDSGSNVVHITWITQYLAENNILYTGSDSYAHNLEKNKALAKSRVLSAGLDTSKFFVVNQITPLREKDISLNYPMFIKPVDRGGGLGIDSKSIVHNFSQLVDKVNEISSNFNSDSLVEEYLDGREFSVAILRYENTDSYQAMPLELVAPKNENGFRILSELVKSNDTETFNTVTNGELKINLSSIAIKMFLALGASDYGRIDIRLDKKGVPQFLEANLIPSLLEGYGNFPKACLLNNLDFETIILRIVKLASDNIDTLRTTQPIIVTPIAAT